VPKRRHPATIDHLLGELEAAIMRLMWAVDTATVREIFDRLHAHGRSLAYTTVMTVMARLAEKQLLTRELAGKTHIYRAALTEDQFVRAAAAKRVQALVDEFGDVAIAQFLATVNELSPERYRELERIARGDDP
jgi:predicted transcriptional regulator